MQTKEGMSHVPCLSFFHRRRIQAEIYVTILIQLALRHWRSHARIKSPLAYIVLYILQKSLKYIRYLILIFY